MIINDIFQEIRFITQKLIELGLTVEENHPVRKSFKISWSNESALSNVIRNIPYIDKYRIINEKKNFNFKLLDGALVQLQYTFSGSGNHLSKHRLAYFPSPVLERYELSPLDYDEKYFGDSEFHDLIESNKVTFPFRFDYSDDTACFKSLYHPFCHLHLGEYDSCRVPVSSPLSPSKFINFIINNFYSSAKEGVFYFNKSKVTFDKTISEEEKKLLHINYVM